MNSKMKTLVVGMAVMASSAVMADISDFTGPEVGATVTVGSGKIKGGSFSTSDTSAGAALHAGYGVQAADDVAVLLGLDYNLSKLKAGKVTDEDGSVANFYFKSPFSVSIGAGKLVNENTLGFAKVSYESTKFSVGEVTTDLRGYGLGAGVRHMIDKNMYLQGELKYTQYTKAVGKSMGDTEITNTQLNVGLGYKF